MPAAYALCPCLNDDDRWIQTLADLVTVSAGGDKTMTILRTTKP